MDERWLLLSLGLILGLLFAGLLGAIMASRRLARRLGEQADLQQQRQDKLTSRLAEYQQGNIRMGEELIALREKVSQLENKQQRLEQQDVHTMPYNQATRLATMGASLDDLMQSCGLTRTEAELLIKLHGNKP